MKKVILGVVVFLLFSLAIFGCTPPVPETTVPPSFEQPAVSTEQQILTEHPDNLDPALEELEIMN